MRLVHEPTDGDDAVLATTIDVADTLTTQTRGLMFRRSLPADYALVFEFDGARTRDVHMLFVFVPIDVVWTVDEVVKRVERLRPWLGFAREEADRIVELPADAAQRVETGDRLRLVDDSDAPADA